MTYEIQPDASEAAETIAERVNEHLIDSLGIDTHDFLIIAESDGGLSISIDAPDDVEEQIQNNPITLGA